MYRSLLSIPLLFTAGLLVSDDGCGGGTEPATWDVVGFDYSAPGPFGTTSSTSTFAAPSGCDMTYDSYLPDGNVVGPLVMLSHGFQRNSLHMADLGAHLASYGFHVITPDLCHSTPTDNDWDGDAADITALALELGADEVAYLGHSAGGMRSVLAAARDPNAVIYYGLDMVDVKNVALDEADGFPILASTTLGEPSVCNTDNNGLAFYESAPEAIALRVTEADHCDFESPTDALCTSFCQGTNDLFDETAIHNAIFGMATSYLLWQTGVEPAAADWWTPGGEAYQHLTGVGLLQPLVP